MDIMEIILLVAGAAILVLSFFIPDKKGGTAGAGALAEDEVRLLVSQELDSVRGHVDDVVEEAVSYAMEKTERSLERLSNEKIMAVNEYSDTVLSEIHKNHEEVMFLYDMLNNKHTSLKGTLSEIGRAVREAEETLQTLQRLAPEATAAEERPVQEPVALTGMAAPEAEAELEMPLRELLDTGHVEDSRETDGSGQNSNDRIMGLYKEGKSPMAIAKELGLGIGEVKLVIGLFNGQ